MDSTERKGKTSMNFVVDKGSTVYLRPRRLKIISLRKGHVIILQVLPTSKTLKRLGFASPLLTTDQANAVLYGGWGLPDVLNPSLYMDGWGFIKKTEYQDGIKTFYRR